MKTTLLFIAMFVSSLLSAQDPAITITSNIDAAEAGGTFTVNYTYTSNNPSNYIFAGLNLYADAEGTWEAFIVGGESTQAPAGTDLTGSITFTIPPETTLTNDLTGAKNYRINIEMKEDVNFAWLAGDYPTTETEIVAAGTLSTNDINLQDKVKLFYSNQKINVSGLDVSDEYQLSLFDLTGREVLSFSKKDNGIISLPSSLYIARLKVNNKESITKKIVIH